MCSAITDRVALQPLLGAPEATWGAASVALANVQPVPTHIYPGGPFSGTNILLPWLTSLPASMLM